MAFTTLVSATELAAHLFDPAWVTLDCRHDLGNPDFGRNAYENGHIPNAQFVHLDRDLSGEKISADGTFLGRHPLPDRTAFILTLRRLGINDDTQVVAYDAHGGMFAARLWWMLRWVGHNAASLHVNALAFVSLGVKNSPTRLPSRPELLSSTHQRIVPSFIRLNTLGVKWLQHIAFQYFDLTVDFFQLSSAIFDQFRTALVGSDRCFQRQLARLHAGDQLIKLCHRFFK